MVVAMARSKIKAKSLPGIFWGEVATTAVFILNQSPTCSVKGMTSCEAWHGAQPPVHFLCTFSYVAHVKVMKPHLKKLDDRSTPMVFIGYEPGAKAYRVYDPVGLGCATSSSTRRHSGTGVRRAMQLRLTPVRRSLSSIPYILKQVLYVATPQRTGVTIHRLQQCLVARPAQGR